MIESSGVLAMFYILTWVVLIRGVCMFTCVCIYSH